MCLFLVLFLGLVIYGVHRWELSDNSTHIGLTIGVSSAVRGISAVEIMLGHIGLATGSLWLYPNRKAGILFVGLFFTLSGYGLIKSLNNKKEYFKHFISHRIFKGGGISCLHGISVCRAGGTAAIPKGGISFI